VSTAIGCRGGAQTGVYTVYWGDPGSALEDQVGYVFAVETEEVDDPPRTQPGFPVLTTQDTPIYSYPQETAFSRLFDATAEEAVNLGVIPGGTTVQVLTQALVGELEPETWYYEQSDAYGNGWVLGANLAPVASR
jgi:hypothetical protein